MFLFVKKIKSPENQASRWLVVIVVSALSSAFAYYAVAHLPFIDFRAYKIGTSIPDAMQPSAPLEYQYIMELNGKREVFDQYPSDERYQFIDMQLRNPEAQPKITDYNIWKGTEDYTAFTMEGTKLIIIITKAAKSQRKSLQDLRAMVPALKAGGVEAVVISSSEEPELITLLSSEQLNLPYFFGDATVLKTIIRSNPGFVLLKEGKVLGKFHYNDLPESETILQIANAQ
jgi:hypothetical protein